MQKIIIISILLFYTCSFLPESYGEDNKIIVIVSPEDKPFVEKLMIDLFSYTIHTPQPELEFNLQYNNPWEIEKVKKYGNIIIASLDFPQDSTGDFLMKRLVNSHKKEEPLFILGDLYAKNQILCGIHSVDAVAMEHEIITNREWILHEFRSIFITRVKEDTYKHGENRTLSKLIDKMFGYTIDLQPDYKIIKSDSLKPFVWLGRGYPYRWITIHKSKKNKYSKQNKMWDQLKTEFSDLMPDIRFGDYKRDIKKQQYEGRSQYIIRGVYEHDESKSGGPFFVYVFDTDSVNEVILVSGFVNYPGHDKLLLLGQLEVIANTLRKGDR